MDLATKDLMKIVKRIIFVFIVTVIVTTVTIFSYIMFFNISFFAINGTSMEPTLKHGDSIILQQDDTIRRNSIVAFTKPRNWNEYTHKAEDSLIKRISAIPGDTLAFYDGKFYVNDEMIFDTVKENYQCEKGLDGFEHTLDASQIFVTGDNAAVSLDSRRIFCDGNYEKMFINNLMVLNYGKVIKVF